VFTQDAPAYDVLVVADVQDAFGEYLQYRTWDPRPVVGTQGLVPTAWHRSQEQWGATQMQNRFARFAGRWMTERDYAAWIAVRSISEATQRERTRPIFPQSLPMSAARISALLDLRDRSSRSGIGTVSFGNRSCWQRGGPWYPFRRRKDFCTSSANWIRWVSTDPIRPASFNKSKVQDWEG
jgi:hypothetical protein